MKRFPAILVLFFLSISLLCVSAISKGSYARAVCPAKDETKSKITNNNYNLFYGDWEVSGFLEGGKGYDPRILSKYIGTKITCYENELIINDNSYPINQYVPYVIAMQDREFFIGSDYMPDDENQLFDIESAYFVAFTIDINLINSSPKDDVILQSQIIVKDNETIVLKTLGGCGGYLTLKRTGFLNNIEVKIPPV